LVSLTTATVYTLLKQRALVGALASTAADRITTAATAVATGIFMSSSFVGTLGRSEGGPPA
jgi:hypothetical protein